MKKISVVIPCYNEEENVGPITAAVSEVFRKELPDLDYEILLIDNDSQDATRDRIRVLCAGDPHIKAIFNAKNFGQFNSPYYAMLQSEGDATILMAADFQDPPEMIPKYVEAWREGYRIAIGIKTHSEENHFMYWLRSQYYGFRRKEIPYDQPKRRAGKTSNNFYKLYDAAMLSVTSYTKFGLRLATFFGAVTMFGSAVIAAVYLVLKLMYWDRFQAGLAPLLIAVLFLGSVIIFFIGMMGEYVLTINQRVMHRPLVVEEERLNFTASPAEEVPEHSGE